MVKAPPARAASVMPCMPQARCGTDAPPGTSISPMASMGGLEAVPAHLLRPEPARYDGVPVMGSSSSQAFIAVSKFAPSPDGAGDVVKAAVAAPAPPLSPSQKTRAARASNCSHVPMQAWQAASMSCASGSVPLPLTTFDVPGLQLSSSKPAAVAKVAALRTQPQAQASARGGSPMTLRRRGSDGLDPQKVVRQVSLPSSRCDTVTPAVANTAVLSHPGVDAVHHRPCSVAEALSDPTPAACARPQAQVMRSSERRKAAPSFSESHPSNGQALGRGNPRGPSSGRQTASRGLSVEVPAADSSSDYFPARSSPDRSGSGASLGLDNDDVDLTGIMPQVPDAVKRKKAEIPVQKARGQLLPEEQLAYNEIRFVEHLGSGEFGQVYRGFVHNEEVAVKQLFWEDSVKTESVVEDLMREIEAFRHLRHKRLVNFVGACLEVPTLCLVTEYMPGGSLHHLLHVRKVRLPLLHCLNLCLQLAEGVLYLHSQVPCIVHRDLKSLNVVLDLSLNLKLCDFGLTEAMEGTHLVKKNNGGSPRYMAPELFDNKSLITEKVDIWSMGCIFSEIFGGPLPYEGINTLPDLHREMLVNRRMPKIPSKIPDGVQDAIRRCYTFDPRMRPSCKRVFEQLKDIKRRLKASGAL